MMTPAVLTLIILAIIVTAQLSVYGVYRVIQWHKFAREDDRLDFWMGVGIVTMFSVIGILLLL